MRIAGDSQTVKLPIEIPLEAANQRSMESFSKKAKKKELLC